MPYIPRERRARYDGPISELIELLDIANPLTLDGDINYIVTRLLRAIYARNGYFDINRAIGVLECAKQEFYRRVAAPYEDERIGEHGDLLP
jgi:hypothetical protein